LRLTSLGVIGALVKVRNLIQLRRAMNFYLEWWEVCRLSIWIFGYIFQSCQLNNLILILNPMYG
jgi:hypothetical protein